MRKILKILLGFVLLSFVAFLLVFVIVNLFDEAPTELAIELEKPLPDNTVPDAQNAFLVLMAFAAPAGEDVIACGRKLVDRSNDCISSGGGKRCLDRDSISCSWGMPRFIGEHSQCNFAGENRCWQQISAEDRERTERLLNDNRALIERYNMLLAMSGYFDDRLPSLYSVLPTFVNMMNVGQLLRDAAMQKAKMGEPDELLLFVESDLRFGRRILSSPSLLIDKLIAIAFIRRDIYAISELLADSAFDASAHTEKIRLILMPLNAIEGSLASTMQKEFLFAVALIRTEDANEMYEWSKILREDNRLLWLVTKLPLQRQATINRHAEYMALVQELTSLSASEFMKQQAVFEQKVAAFSAKYEVRNWLGFAWFYDFPGKSIYDVGDYRSYIAYLHDTAAHLQLVRAQAEIRLAGIPADKVTDFLAQHPELSNPYTEQPFTWDAGKRMLSFIAQANAARSTIKKGEPFPVSLP